jgi:hypothetical protein
MASTRTFKEWDMIEQRLALEPIRIEMYDWSSGTSNDAKVKQI